MFTAVAMLKNLVLSCVIVAYVGAYQSTQLRSRRDTIPKEINQKWNATNADKLKRELLLNYDKFTRPSTDGNATVVHFDPSIYHVEMDEEKSTMSVHCWVKMTWTDEKLRWNEGDYGGLSELHLADHEIWQPDVVPWNSAEGSSVDQFGNTLAIVNHLGSVVWAPPAILKVFCDINLRKWPFDTQMCTIKVGSWTYSGKQIDLQYSEEVPSFDNILANAEWKFVSIARQRSSLFYSCCSDPYVDLMFNLTITRRSPTYTALIVTPITAIVFMTLATFWLPVSSNDKIYLGGTTALVIALFLIYFTQKLSVIAGHTPLIVEFYANSLYLVAFSMIISVTVINLASGPKTKPVPWILKSYITGRLGRLLLLHNFLSRSSIKLTGDDETADNRPVFAAESHDSPVGCEETSAKTIQDDWRLLATAIDRMAFILYCFLFICFALAYSV